MANDMNGQMCDLAQPTVTFGNGTRHSLCPISTIQQYLSPEQGLDNGTISPN